MIKVKNHLDFALFEYESVSSKNIELGDIVYKPGNTIYNDDPEIGVVIQIHDDDEFRTDMFGNSCITEVTPATMEQIENIRPKLLKSI